MQKKGRLNRRRLLDARANTETGAQKEIQGLSRARRAPAHDDAATAPRQSGKTVATAGYVLPTIFQGIRESIAYVTGSQDQSEDLFRDNFRAPIDNNPRLKRRCNIVGPRITVPKTGSSFDFGATSIAGTTGGTRTAVIIDEARAVGADIALALMPQIFARNGWECPTKAKGHTKTNGDLEDPNHPTECETCGERLEPWVGKILAMSSAGELSGGQRDWFHEACEEAEQTPHPRIHVYRATGVINPKISTAVVNTLSDFFGKLESTRDATEIEMHGISRRKGEQFISSSELAMVVDKTLGNQMSGHRPCVGFLDTSLNTELSSLVIVADDSDPSEDPWHRLVVEQIEVWDPKTLPQGIIDPDMIEAHLDACIPNFPMLALAVDDRNMPWAVKKLKIWRKSKPWRHIVHGVTGHWGRAERRAGWNSLNERILSRRWRMPDHKRAQRELRTARKFRAQDNSFDVREPSRRTNHLDVAEGMASCCYMVMVQASKGGGVRLSQTGQRGRRRQSAVQALRSRGPITGGLGPDAY